MKKKEEVKKIKSLSKREEREGISKREYISKWERGRRKKWKRESLKGEEHGVK